MSSGQIEKWVGLKVVSARVGESFCGGPGSVDRVDDACDHYENEFVIELSDGSTWKICGPYDEGVSVRRENEGDKKDAK